MIGSEGGGAVQQYLEMSVVRRHVTPYLFSESPPHKYEHVLQYFQSATEDLISPFNVIEISIRREKATFAR